ncbi:MAG: hypothetical protein EOP04_11240 [Proteobacteria bacterium]|nr:MAG: hypothetical protein EOP04_11240 [Pseudomonadota bacterium]
MKSVLLLSLLVSTTAVAADVCKPGDLKDCVRALKAKEGSPEFIAHYDQVCKDNKGFRCLKRTVRGEVSEEMKYIREEYPKATFFTVKDGTENKVFVLEKK